MRVEPVLAIDPGKLTGVARLTRVDDTVCVEDSWELAEDEIIPAIRPILAEWKGDPSGFNNSQFGGTIPLRVVIERFTITAETAKKSQAPFSLEVIGAVKQACRDVGYPMGAIVMQKPSEAKNVFPNAKLKRLGLWHIGGHGHALDAIRHGALYLVRSGWSDSRFLVEDSV